MNTDIESYLAIGRVVKTHGLKGEIQVIFSEELHNSYFQSGILFLEENKKPIPYFIQEERLRDSSGYMLLEDVDSVNTANRVVGKTILIPLALVPKKKAEAFTYKDLSGFMAIDSLKGNLNTIDKVEEYPQQFVASLKLNEKEIMIPLNAHTVNKIDIKNKKVILNIPEGLIDVYLEE
jgi:16S rRNA processing protein RimM